jgi:PAS domain S-box-containing protein
MQTRSTPPPAFGYIVRVEDGPLRAESLRAEWVSQSFTKVTGYTPEDLDREGLFSLVAVEDRPIVNAALETLAGGREWAGDFRLLLKSGEWKWLRFFAHPARDEDGSLKRFEGSGHDVTEMRHLEAHRRISDGMLKLLDEAVWPIMWTIDENLIVTSSRGVGLKLFDFAPDEKVGSHITEIVGTDDPSNPANRAVSRALQGETVTYDLEWKGHLFVTVVEPIRDDDGTVIGVAGVSVAKDVVARDLLDKDVLRLEQQGPPPEEGQSIVVADITIDPLAYSARKGTTPLRLSPTEFRLLWMLATHPNEALSRQELLKEVWHHDFMGDSRLVDMAINRLRAKIEDDPPHPQRILTVRGVGYRFETPEGGGSASAPL